MQEDQSKVPKKDPEFKMKPVMSSNISAAGYDPITQTLRITFSQGTTYEYDGVPQEVYNAMWSAESVGKFVRANIAKSYPFKKIK